MQILVAAVAATVGAAHTVQMALKPYVDAAFI